MNPTSIIALGNCHQQDIRRLSERSRAASELAGRQRPLRARVHLSLDVLGLASRRRRHVLPVAPATRHA